MVLHFAAVCCNIINVLLAWIAFLLPALTTKSSNEKPYWSTGVWSTCSTSCSASIITGDCGDDYQCLGWNDPRGSTSGISQGFVWEKDGKFFANVGNLYKDSSKEYTNTPNHISITMGLYTTSIVLMSLGGYTACCAIGMKKLSYVSGLCNFLAGIFFLATAIFVFGTDRFGVTDCICNKNQNGVMVCTSTQGDDSPSRGACFGWNYSAIYLWVAWLLCWSCAGMSGGHGSSGDKEPAKQEESHEDEGATTGKI